ncbi:MAG: penicillin-binding protein 2, partial [Actinomycetota bacterium]|nr:penicillin-binding protein 2 [Actinomycetota bacterium]
MFVALSTRLWFLQVLASEQYRAQASQNSVRLVEEPAPRGRILDDRGNVLVGNRISLTVTINRQELGDQEPAVLQRLSSLLNKPVRQLRRQLDNPQYYPFTPVPVAFDVPPGARFYIGEHPGLFPGVTVIELPVRTYPYGDLAAHVLGYIGSISPQQLKDPAFAGYSPSDLVGTAGVEEVYEPYLQGSKGIQKYRVDASGRNLGSIGPGQAPVAGDTLHLTLDEKIQKLAEQSLLQGEEQARHYLDVTSGKYLQANAGAVVVMDPQTGGIAALASSPTYDPSQFVGGITQQELDRLGAPAANQPLFDRAIQAQYPPGSTYKPFVAASALHTGIANTNTSYACPASYKAPGDTSGTVFNNWSSSSLGNMNLAEALVQSCDTVFYPFGYQYYLRYYHSPPSHPSEQLQHDLRTFGFGRPTLVDLPAEQPGVVPDAQWKRDMHKANPTAFPNPVWYPGDDIQMSIGQGDTLVTPLQMATALSAIANGGKICVPHVADTITAPGGGPPVKTIKSRCHGKLPFTSAQLTYIRNALTQVPITGTAAPAFGGFPFSRVWVAGKTGTAEVVGKQNYSWFAAMVGATPNHPDYVVVALVEQGGHGSTTAAPIVRRIIEGLYGLTLSNPNPAAPRD